MSFTSKILLIYIPLLLKLLLCGITVFYFLKLLSEIDHHSNMVEFNDDANTQDSSPTKIKLLRRLLSTKNNKKSTPKQLTKTYIAVTIIVLALIVITSLKDMYEFTLIYITFLMYIIHKNNFLKTIEQIKSQKEHKKTFKEICIVYVIPSYLIIIGIMFLVLIIRTSFF